MTNHTNIETAMQPAQDIEKMPIDAINQGLIQASAIVGLVVADGTSDDQSGFTVPHNKIMESLWAVQTQLDTVKRLLSAGAQSK